MKPGILCKHISRAFPIWKHKKKHIKILTKTCLSGPSPPKYYVTIMSFRLVLHMSHMVWHHPMHMQRAHAQGKFCLIFSPGRRPMRTHKCILFFLQKFWIFWICNQILCGRCASTDFCQVSFRVKTLAPDLEGLRTDFPWVNYMVRKTSFSSFSQCIHVLCASHIFPVKKSKQKIPGAIPCSTRTRGLNEDNTQ